MATFHAASEQYELGELDGRLVAFTNMRLDRESVPDGLHCYDIRDSDHLDGSCAEVKNYVMVNHLTKPQANTNITIRKSRCRCKCSKHRLFCVSGR